MDCSLSATLISTNGTKVKGQKVRWAALLPDDWISLGRYKLRVYLGPDDEPGPSELARMKAQRPRKRPSPAPAPADRQAEPRIACPASGAQIPSAGRVETIAQSTLPREVPRPAPLELDVVSSGQKVPDPSVSPGSPASEDSIISLVFDHSDEIIKLD